MIPFFFYTLAFVAVVAATSTILQRNPVASAISLVITLACQAGLYILLDGHFVATMQILVYTGAIMVLFIFVIMLLNLQDHELGEGHYAPWKFVGGAMAILGGAFIVSVLAGTDTATATTIGANFGTIEQIGVALFSKYLFPFEVLSLVLTTAIAGAVILGKKTL